MRNGFPVWRAEDDAAVSIPLTGIATTTGYTPTGGSTVAAVGGTSIIGPFNPDIIRSVYAEIVGTGATGNVKILRSRDNGTTKLTITSGGVPWGTYDFSTTTGVIVNENVDKPESDLFLYYLSITLAAGSVTYSIFQ